jgi:hypothetical protein
LCLNIKDYHQIFFYSKNSFSEYNFNGFIEGFYIFGYFDGYINVI